MHDVVLLHGFTNTGACWEPVVRALSGARLAAPDLRGPDRPASGGARVLTPDLRGHGAAADVRPVSLAAVLDDLDGVVPAEAVLVGYSMGGRIALHYALRRPERLRALVLVGASPGLADPAERAARRAADARLADRIERIGLEAFAAEWAALPLWEGMPAAVAAAAHADRLRNTPAGLAAALRGLGTGELPPLWDRLSDLHVPVALVAGERDAKFREIAERTASRLPAARVEIVPGAGHAAHLEAPERVAAVVQAAT